MIPSSVLWTIHDTFSEEDTTHFPHNEGDLDKKYGKSRHSEKFLEIVVPEKKVKPLKNTFE